MTRLSKVNYFVHRFVCAMMHIVAQRGNINDKLF